MCINKEIIKDSSKRHWERWPLISRQGKWKVCRRTSEIQELISEESVKASSSNYVKHGDGNKQVSLHFSAPCLHRCSCRWKVRAEALPKLAHQNTLRAFHRNFFGSFMIKYVWWMQKVIYIHLNGLWDWEAVQHQHSDFTRTLLWHDISHSVWSTTTILWALIMWLKQGLHDIIMGSVTTYAVNTALT